jgi:hypothetical protein
MRKDKQKVIITQRNSQ